MLENVNEQVQVYCQPGWLQGPSLAQVDRRHDNTREVGSEASFLLGKHADKGRRRSPRRQGSAELVRQEARLAGGGKGPQQLGDRVSRLAEAGHQDSGLQRPES